MTQAEDAVFLRGSVNGDGCHCIYQLGGGRLLTQLRSDPEISCNKCCIDKQRIWSIESCACSDDAKNDRVVFFKFSSFTLRLVVPEPYLAQEWIANALGFDEDSIKILHTGQLLYPIANNSTTETDLSIRIFDLSRSKKAQLLVVGTRPKEHLKSTPASKGSNQAIPLAWLAIPVAAAIIAGIYWSRRDS